MIYYRLAWKSNQASTWQWKSTKLTSIDVVFRFIRTHNILGYERLCIFFSSSAEGLNEQLAQKNQGLATDSVSVEEFLRMQGIMAIGNSETEQDTQLRQENGSAVVATNVSLQARGREEQSFSDRTINAMHKRRLAHEQGMGGDHDMHYTFTLPSSMPQMLAWIKLLGKVQRGELEP